MNILGEKNSKKRPLSRTSHYEQTFRYCHDYACTPVHCVDGFCGLVGYGVCFTRRKSPVRSWAEPFAFTFFFWPGGALFARAFFVRAGPGQPARAPAQGPQGRLALPQYGHGWLQRHEKKKKKPTHGLCSSGRFPGPVYRARHRQLQRIPARSWLGTYWPQKRRSRLTNKNDQPTNPHSIL